MPSSDYLYDIEVLGFRGMGREEAVAGLMTTFGINIEHAGKMFDRIPIRVKTGATDVETERYVRSLLRIGAEVRVMNGPHVRVYMPEDLLDRQPPLGSSAPQQTAGSAPPVPQSAQLGSAHDSGGQPAQAKPSSQTSMHSDGLVPDDREDVDNQIETAICPQCGFEQPKSERCAQCGVVLESDPYDLIRQHTRQESAVTDQGSASSPLFQRSSIGANPFVVTMEDDDGLFADGRRTFDPGGMLRGRPASGAYAAAQGGSHQPVPSSPSAQGNGGTNTHRTKSFRDSFPGLGGGSAAASIAVDVPGVELGRERFNDVDRVAVGDDRDFWTLVPSAFTFPLKGSGGVWLLLFAAISGIGCSLGAFVLLIPVSIGKGFLLLFYLACIAGLMASTWRFFADIFSQVVAGEESGPDLPSIADIEDFKSEYLLPGYFFLFGAFLLMSPFFFVWLLSADKTFLGFTSFLSSPAGIVLALLPVVYWPIGLATTTFSGKLLDFLDFRKCLSGIAQGGLEYLFLSAITLVLGVGYAVSFQTMQLEQLWYADLVFWVLFGYLTGVQAYLMGRLYRKRPTLLDTEQAG